MTAPELERGTVEHHYIEEAAVVWLALNSDGTGWDLDHRQPDDGLVSMYSDYGDMNGPSNSECQCGDETKCDAERHRVAQKVEMPTPVELMKLIADTFGYTVTKTEAGS